MSIQNVFDINVDLKQSTVIKTPIITKNDTVVFNVHVYDDGKVFDISEGKTFSIFSKRSDGQVIGKAGTVTGQNTIQFSLGKSETSVPGVVSATIQIYDKSGRVSTFPFYYQVLDDPSIGYELISTEVTLLQSLINKTQDVIDSANAAVTKANEAASSANEAVKNATNAAREAAQAANDAATKANNEAKNAKNQGDYAKRVGDENKTRWLTAVNTYADIATTYPNPQLGDTVQTIDDSKIYRWDGTQWVWTQQYNANAITDVQNKIGILYKRADWISVKEFGAAGDGVTDDTTAIQNALNAINTNGGGVLYFPKGIYRITSALVIYDNTTIIGEGKIKVDSAVSSTALTNANYGTDGTLKNYNIKIMNIELEGGAYTSGGNSTTCPAGINLGNVVGGMIFNVKVKGFDQNGIILESCENVKVINNYVENGRHGITIAAISSNVSKNIQVIGNYVYNQEDTNILVTENSIDVIISDNICDKTNWGHGIDLAGCSKTIVKGNIIRRTKNISTSGEACGIYIHDYLSYVSNHNVIEGNLIDVENNPGGSVVGIKLSNESNYALIRANMIKDATIGISLIGNMSNTSIMPDDFVVCDNILQGITSYGFYIDIVAYGIISNNFINTINTANVMRLHPSTYGLTIQGNRVSGGSTTVTINSNNYLNNNFINNDSPISRPFSTPTTINDSTAGDVATLKNDFNNLLSKLRAQGILRSGY